MFAKRDLPRNEFIADYNVGNIPYTNEQLEALYPGDTLATHAWRKSQNLTYDAVRTNSISGKFNSCRPADKRAGKCRGNNARITSNGRVRTGTGKNGQGGRLVREGDEIFVAYGPEYWRGRVV